MNCPNCGAAVKEGKFCNYCGAKLPDDTKRVEVNINKKIEDVAEIKRAEYETRESELWRRKEEREYRSRTVKRWACLILLAINAGLVLYGFIARPIGTMAFFSAIGIFAGVFVLIYILWQLISGRW